jgi:hemoglobin
MSAELESAAAAADSPYARLGGAPAVQALVRRFYALMDELPEAQAVRRLHPESLADSIDSLSMFLSGWFGGPPLYMRERGHPRLRMRHAPFAIGQAEREAWMRCMRQALEEQVDDAALREALHKAFADMAAHIVNRVG